MSAVPGVVGAVTPDRAGGHFWQETAETMPLERLRDTQLERLGVTLRRAYEHIPFYRKKLDEAGIAPDDVLCHGDASDLPFTTKIDLRDHYPFGMFAVPREELV
ncbi:MAG TPA: hypothetical protein VK576_03125, partial [Thermoleophilia bacterium]|nr:hypothetical protein [Thermoleophilia bacterium]